MPLVTVWPMPNGLPTARTRSPTSTMSLSAKVIAGRFFASTFTTARSDCGSVPMTLAVSSRPSLRETLMRSAPFTTWLFVRM